MHVFAGSRFDQRLKLAVGLLTAAGLLTLALLRTADLWWRRTEILHAGEQRAANLASILSEYIRGTFAAVDVSLQDLARQGQRAGSLSALGDDWLLLLTSAKANLTGVGSLSVMDAGGRIRYSTVGAIVGQSRSNEYVFKRLLGDPSDVLVVSTPIRALTNRFVIPLGRRLVTKDGRFDGTIVASFTPEDMRGFFRTVDVGRRGSIWVLHVDGVVLFREPSETNPIGDRAKGNPIFEAVQRGSGTGVVRGPIGPDSDAMVTAFQTLKEQAFIVAVSLNENELLGEWRREVGISAAVVAVLALGASGILFMLVRQLNARALAEQALSRSQRLESIGQLTGGVAHDFNNMLTIISGNLEFIKEAPHASEVTEEIRYIEDAARNAAELTRSLLTFARRQPLKPEILDLNEAVRGLEPMLARLLGEDLALTLKPASTACLVNVDVAQLETAIVNLGVNARDAMPQGGLLVLETGMAVLDDSYAALNPDVRPGRYATLSVSDTGVGIPPENLSRAFEPFFTTKEPGKGTGLGLSMVYGFVRQSGGQIKIYSEVGHGTAVKMYFPAVTDRQQFDVDDRLAEAESRGSGEVILLVEDLDSLRKLTARVLDQLGYRVIAAGDGPQALDLARQAPRIDLLLTDVMLPKGMNGRQLGEALTRERPGLRVLYVSGYSEEIIQHRGSIEPGVQLVTKPFTKAQLAEAIRVALGSRSPADPASR